MRCSNAAWPGASPRPTTRTRSPRTCPGSRSATCGCGRPSTRTKSSRRGRSGFACPRCRWHRLHLFQARGRGRRSEDGEAAGSDAGIANGAPPVRREALRSLDGALDRPYLAVDGRERVHLPLAVRSRCYPYRPGTPVARRCSPTGRARIDPMSKAGQASGSARFSRAGDDRTPRRLTPALASSAATPAAWGVAIEAPCSSNSRRAVGHLSAHHSLMSYAGQVESTRPLGAAAVSCRTQSPPGRRRRPCRCRTGVVRLSLRSPSR